MSTDSDDRDNDKMLHLRTDTVAALYVETGGVYFGVDGVDPWDITRDARTYAGPWPVIAHPPCSTWGRYRTGDDGGCFHAALSAVRNYGGVLEHPADSRAWMAYGLRAPDAGWTPAGDFIGWTCRIEQGHYGHRARKATWLYAAHVELPSLPWHRSAAQIKPRPGRDPVRERRIGAVQRMSRKARARTPIAFRDLLIAIARSAHG